MFFASSESRVLNRRQWGRWAVALAVALGATAGLSAHAADEAPDRLIQRFSDESLQALRNDEAVQAGDVVQIGVLVDKLVMPHVNFRRMTASAVGPGWRKATPEQQQRLQQEFKALLVRTYAGAWRRSKNETISVKPLRAQPTDTDVLVRTEVRGRAEPVQLDYRLEKTPGEGAGWKIYNLNVHGRVAGGNLPQPVRAGNQHPRCGRLAGQPGRAQRRWRPRNNCAWLGLCWCCPRN